MEKKKKVTHRKVAQTLLQERSLKSLKRINHDPLWHQVPEMGVEWLIATVDSKRELKKSHKDGVRKKEETVQRKDRVT